ncbi:CapA family protein [Rhizomonospora bruguierae]|uniref:CapA family protein n=1 Tax=Rhizomonospora bruguierae TaxID=1581705 RepID=UPI001BD1BABF|nr:CapA family protein [Micromonospora sp. NBRC 107566]
MSQGVYASNRHRSAVRRRLVVVGAVLAILVGTAVAGYAAVIRGDGGPGHWQAAPTDAPGGTGGATQAAPTEDAAPDQVITLSATGDIVMGNAPSRLPPNGGQGFFDAVREALKSDLPMGNLEEPLTNDTGVRKCGANSTACHQFRAPPEYAKHLKQAGFKLLNQANNHGYDYGAAGYENTQQALEAQGLKHTGAPDQITVVEVKGVKVAVLGFSSYRWSNSLIDLAAAKRVVAQAAKQADVVVVQVHMGAEGSDKTRVKRGTEMFSGENRGDPMAFSRAVIDAGADLVVGHGPHVLRGMEFYKGRLIAYSLGNFAGGQGTLSNSGRLAWGGVLHVSLHSDGTWAGGEFRSTYMNGSGRPTPDPDNRGLKALRDLSQSDFGGSAATFGSDGEIKPPAA